MNKIITLDQLPRRLLLLQNEHEKIVLAGGGFDILHKGHITFLTEAKKHGDILIVLLESDASLRRRKGTGRPVHSQDVRAKILSSVTAVTSIVLLPAFTTDQQYDTVVLQIKPAIIATTKGDPGRHHKERQAALCGAAVVDVIDRLPQFASSNLVKGTTP